VIFENNWVLWTVVIVSVVFGAFLLFMLLQQDQYQWITANGYKIQNIPRDATIVFVNNSMEKRVGELYKAGRLVAFVGQSISGGIDTVSAREKAKLNAYKELAEYFNVRVQTFAALVEGQLQSTSDSRAQEVKSIALEVYKRVTQMFSEAQISGAYVYAIWEERVGSLVYTNVLLVFDPEGVIEALKANEEINKQIAALGKSGVDFFKALNSVIEEAKK
jgi:cytochrome c-type biogenesis protein CcmH/NrfF